MTCQAIVIGGSAGAPQALEGLLAAFWEAGAPPVLLAQHLHASDSGEFSRHLAERSGLAVIEPCDKQPIERAGVYVAPANYHMQVERERTISLSVDPKVNWSRPSIDVLFETAAAAWQEALAGVILSGASADGTRGLHAVKAAGGRTIAQDPATAATPFMPQAAMNAGVVDEVLSPQRAGVRLLELAGMRRETLQGGEVREK